MCTEHYMFEIIRAKYISVNGCNFLAFTVFGLNVMKILGHLRLTEMGTPSTPSCTHDTESEYHNTGTCKCI